MSDGFEPDQVVARFRERAEAVKRRNIPPVEGADRKRFIEQAEKDYFDFSLVADSEVSLEDGILTFRVDLRPSGEDR